MHVLIFQGTSPGTDAIEGILVREKFAVDVASDPHQCLWMVAEQAYDAILLELSILRVDIYELCRCIHRLQPATPVMAIEESPHVGRVVVSATEGVGCCVVELGAPDLLVAGIRAYVLQAQREK